MNRLAIAKTITHFMGREPIGHRISNFAERAVVKVPSRFFVNMAFGSIIASAGIAAFTKRKDVANFVGLWAPSLFLMGVFNRLARST